MTIRFGCCIVGTEKDNRFVTNQWFYRIHPIHREGTLVIMHDAGVVVGPVWIRALCVPPCKVILSSYYISRKNIYICQIPLELQIYVNTLYGADCTNLVGYFASRYEHSCHGQSGRAREQSQERVSSRERPSCG